MTGRRGCDLAPVDPRTAEGRQLLTSFVWPFDLHRHARLAVALELAARHLVPVDRAAAADWLAQQLAAPAEPHRPEVVAGTLTVVWQSVTALYWPTAEVAEVDRLLEQHGQRHRIARVSMEYGSDPTGDDRTGAPRSSEPPAGERPVLRTWLADPASGTGPRSRRLGTVHDHGVPVRLTG